MRLIGRERELDRALRLLDRARSERVARILRVTGNSGNGKTALVREIQEQAGARGWLTVYVAAHRIQAGLPLVVARRAVEEIGRVLGDEADRYRSGLERTLATPDEDPKAFQAAVMQLIDGVLHDRPIVLFVDDVQWCDAESRALLPAIVQRFADRSLVLLLSERTDETSDTAIDLVDETIVVDALKASAAEALARHLMPGASPDVITAVADHALGRPIDIATIASLSSEYETMTPEDVAASARSIIARDVAAAPAAVREFLQICSLIGDPLDYELLRAMFSETQLLSFIAASSGRYLVEDDGLRFVHASVAQSILETIAIEIPYRKRIISSLESMDVKTPQRYELLMEQAAACGDQTLEFRYAMELSSEAQKRGALALVASALERAIPLAPPDVDVLPLYTQLATIHLIRGRGSATSVAREALDYAKASNRKSGIGAIVASLLFSIMHNGKREEFYDTLGRYEEMLSEPQDRAHLLGPKLYAAACDNDPAAFEKHAAELTTLGLAQPIHHVRLQTFRGILAGRSGKLDDARRSFREARNVSEKHSVAAAMIDAGEPFLILHGRGANNEEFQRALRALEKHDGERVALEVMELLAAGAAGDAMDRLLESYVHQDTPFHRRLLLGVAGSISVLSQTPLPAQLSSDIEREIPSTDTPSLVPLLSAAAALTPDTAVAQRLAQRALSISRKPFEIQLLWLPIVLARAAVRSNATDVLIELTRREAHDAFPWTVAQHRFAQLTARRALKQAVPADEPRELIGWFNELGSPYFAQLVQSLGANTDAPKSEVSKLTRREREVAELVAAGRSNREIAEQLVLSERTIEGHIANIFGKLNVGSRSQIATWYVTSAVSHQ